MSSEAGRKLGTSCATGSNAGTLANVWAVGAEDVGEKCLECARRCNEKEFPERYVDELAFEYVALPA